MAGAFSTSMWPRMAPLFPLSNKSRFFFPHFVLVHPCSNVFCRAQTSTVPEKKIPKYVTFSHFSFKEFRRNSARAAMEALWRAVRWRSSKMPSIQPGMCHSQGPPHVWPQQSPLVVQMPGLRLPFSLCPQTEMCCFEVSVLPQAHATPSRVIVSGPFRRFFLCVAILNFVLVYKRYSYVCTHTAALHSFHTIAQDVSNPTTQGAGD